MLDPVFDSRFLDQHNLLAWYPKGILDYAMASTTVDFLTFHEHLLDKPFNRFAAWSLVSEVHVNLEQVNDLAATTIDFLTFHEHMLDEPFNRFSDWSLVSEMHIDLEQVNDLAAKRRKTYGNGPPVKSAFLAATFPASVIALMFSQVMKGSPIH